MDLVNNGETMSQQDILSHQEKPTVPRMAYISIWWKGSIVFSHQKPEVIPKAIGHSL